MATERKRAIRSAAGWVANQAAMEALYGVGNYYTTLSAWEAAEQADLVAIDEIRTAVCYRDWPAGLNDHLILDGWVSDATRYPRVTVAEAHRHGGVPNAGFWVNRSVDYDGPVSIRQAYSQVEWIEARNTSTSGIAVTASNAKIINCIGRSGWFPNAAFSVSGANGLYVQCLAYSSGRGFVCADWTTSTLVGCVSANHQTHGYMSGGGSSITLKNCISYGNGEQAYQGGSWNAASTNNATSSATDDAPGGNSVVGVTAASFVDSAANDMHLAAGSPLIGAGVNLYAQITHDIDGDAWPSSGAWDIGFDHYVSGGGGTEQPISAAGTAQATGSATPAAAIALAGVGVALATGSGALSGAQSAPIAADGGATAAGAAAPSIDIALSAMGFALASGSATAGGAAAGSLAAAGSASASGTAALVASVTIGAEGLAQAAASAGLSADILAAGAGAALAAGHATLAAQLVALAQGAARASGSATLAATSDGSLLAAGGATAMGGAALALEVRLEAAGAAGVTGSGRLVSDVALTAAGFVQAMGAGYVVLQVDLAAAGGARASGTATATAVDTLVLIESARWRVASGRHGGFEVRSGRVSGFEVRRWQ